jgi:uncharacterized protein YjbI with pentapeptide repeats
MSSGRAIRLSYEESCRLLQRHGYPDAGAAGSIPPIPDHRPQCDDGAPLGVSFFRTFVGQDIEQGDEDVSNRDLENLTLPRTFFGRSYIQHVSFRNTDLSESTLCWNDFSDVNFTDADLTGCDLRASHFSAINFVRASLRNADLRRSSFEACDFTEADMRGAKLTHDQDEELILSEQQQREIDWQDSDGDEPPGG